MDVLTFTCLLALSAGFYAAWNIGANDVSNAMGTSVGSKSLTLRQAVIVAAVCEFLGAWLFGSNVSETLRSGIINTDLIASLSSNGDEVVILGMLSSLLATGVWLNVASFWGLPVSTTHSIVGAIVGFGLIAGGKKAIYWSALGKIASSWIISPFLGAIGSYTIFMIIRRTILIKPVPLKAAKKALPYFFSSFLTFLFLFWMCSKEITSSTIVVGSFSIFVLCLLFFRVIEGFFIAKESAADIEHIQQMERLVQLQHHKKTLRSSILHEKADEAISDIENELQKITTELHPAALSQYESKQFHRLERLFGLLQISTACLMAFAHGANDVANAIGPLEAILQSLSDCGNKLASFALPNVLLLGGVGIVIGLATWGWRVIETIGKNITELTPSRGFSAEFGASITILLASQLGLPISTTHTLVGAVIGVGFAGGITSLNSKTLKDIVTSWIVTVPAGALLSIFWFQVLSTIYSRFF